MVVTTNCLMEIKREKMAFLKL